MQVLIRLLMSRYSDLFLDHTVHCIENSKKRALSENRFHSKIHL